MLTYKNWVASIDHMTNNRSYSVSVISNIQSQREHMQTIVPIYSTVHLCVSLVDFNKCSVITRSHLACVMVVDKKGQKSGTLLYFHFI